MGGTLSGGRYIAADGAGLVFTTSGGTLDGVTLDSDIDLASPGGARAMVTNGLTLDGVTVRLGNVTNSASGQLYFNGDQALGGSGTMLFGRSYSNLLYPGQATTLTLGSGITVRGSSRHHWQLLLYQQRPHQRGNDRGR